MSFQSIFSIHFPSRNWRTPSSLLLFHQCRLNSSFVLLHQENMPALASPSLMVGWFPVSPSSCRQQPIVVSRCGSEMSEGVADARTSQANPLTFLMTSGLRKTAAAAARKIPSTVTWAHHRIARHRRTFGHSTAASALAAEGRILAASTSSGIVMYSPRPPLAATGDSIRPAIRPACADGTPPPTIGAGGSGNPVQFWLESV
jgi:hypothetical protein